MKNEKHAWEDVYAPGREHAWEDVHAPGRPLPTGIKLSFRKKQHLRKRKPIDSEHFEGAWKSGAGLVHKMGEGI